MIQEPTTVGLSANAHATLKTLEAAGVFHRLVDAYRFAASLGLAHGAYDTGNTGRVTIFNVGTVDPDRTLFEAVAALRANLDEPVYRTFERYAEWGVKELGRLHSGGEIDLGPLLKEAEALLD